MIIGTLASIPQREECLREALDSLIDQFDRFHVTLNGYDEIPKWLTRYPLIITLDAKNTYRDMARLIPIDQYDDGYVFQVDDDIAYPKDYVERMVQLVDLKNCLACVHGSTLKENWKTYICDRTVQHFTSKSCLKEVQFPGGGTTAFSLKRIPFKFKDITDCRLGGDVWMSFFSKRASCKIFCIDRPENWLRSIYKEGPGIYHTIKQSPRLQKLQTDFVRQYLA